MPTVLLNFIITVSIDCSTTDMLIFYPIQGDKTMQFKKVSNRIQVLAYRGYDKIKCRSIIKMVGSLDGHTFEPTDGLLNSITAQEKLELQSYIERERQEANKKLLQEDINKSACNIKKVTDALKSGDFEFPEGWSDEMWKAIDSLTHAMRRAGFKRPPRKPKKAPQSALSVQAMFDIEKTQKMSPDPI